MQLVLSKIINLLPVHAVRDRTKSTNVVALVSCDKDISGHKSFLSITDVNSEKELLLARAGIFSPPSDPYYLPVSPLISRDWLEQRGSNM